MKKMAMIAARAAVAAALAGCAVHPTDTSLRLDCATKWADASPSHPLCTDSPDHAATSTTQAPSELDREAQEFSPDDAAFLRDLHGVWEFSFNPAEAVREAHAMCEFPQGKTATALPDIVNMIDPGNNGTTSLGVMDAATKFMGVAGRHFCPGH